MNPPNAVLPILRKLRNRDHREGASVIDESFSCGTRLTIFVWRARAILDALKIHRPNLFAALERVGQALGTPQEAEVIAREYPLM